MSSRKMTLTWDEGVDDATANTQRNVSSAVGYLAGWGKNSDRYKEVFIFGDSEGNVHGSYRNGAGDVTYSLFGLRGTDGSYSFHS